MQLLQTFGKQTDGKNSNRNSSQVTRNRINSQKQLFIILICKLFFLSIFFQYMQGTLFGRIPQKQNIGGIIPPHTCLQYKSCMGGIMLLILRFRGYEMEPINEPLYQTKKNLNKIFIENRHTLDIFLQLFLPLCQCNTM